MIELRVVGPGHPDAVALDERVQEYYRSIYGEGDATELRDDEFEQPNGIYLVGYDGGRPIASGGWRSSWLDPSDPVPRPGDAEIKRMYVVPEARGAGHATALLVELERTAAECGRTRMILETGTAQPDAIALYRSCGYSPIPVFGAHRADPRSRCFGKPLRG